MSPIGTAVVTGGNRGIGLAVARELTRQNYRVVLVTRDQARGEQAVAELGGTTEFVAGDLSALQGIRSVAKELRERPIDLLVHNAGIWPTRLVRTADGFEQAFAVNHLAPFLLNHLLEEQLLASGTRVVQVSAGLYAKGRVDLERTPTGADFHRIRTYCSTKLANLLTVPLFAKRWQDTGVSIGAVHPGVINTGLGDSGGPLGLVLKLVKRSWGAPEQGAAPVVRLALGTEDPAGRYFDQHNPAAGPGDPRLAEQLWKQASTFVA